MKEVYFKVKGRVQGVGFRWFAAHEAQKIGGLSGWVRNEADGSVEILVRGEEPQIDALLLVCQKGPELARVDKLEFVVGRLSGFLPPITSGVFRRI